ncbi:ABC transporter ATPase [Candidatus Francisella endociliophora]|uniref:ABC transporter ATPase n=1 Tax=Candidatus Francisella endociliophora TaxID=653937 RepID=A0A097EM07_9GAMM|nr:extracellular solute-binding protein [Francisella sp. FSC1006]AIT08578.1 ABC transporter ATPase [Francisella sp. FSC1006]
MFVRSVVALLTIFVSVSVYADVNLYGPGGPHTALIDAAKKFEEKTNIKVNVNFGPESTWTDKAKKDADILFGPSQQSATGIIHNFSDKFDIKDLQPMYYHDAIILVKKGNPKNIHGIDDLAKPNTNIVVIDGAGYSNTSGTGVWEDIVGRKHDINFMKAFRKNIIEFAPNSGSAFKAFKQDNADAWITWRDWAISNPDEGEVVNVSPKYNISRDFNIVVNKENKNPEVDKFVEFLQSNEALKSFYSYGWYTSR